jgi:hypothetical protein
MTTTDSNGILFLETTDPISPFQTLINALQTATSTALSARAKLFKSAVASPPSGAVAGDLWYQMYDGATWRRLNNYAQYTVTATCDSAGNFSGTFPAGLFTLTPVITTSTLTNSQFSFANGIATSTTAFSGKVGYFPGGTGGVGQVAGFLVSITATQATALSVTG